MKKEKDMDIFVNISHKKIHANYFKVEYMDELLNGRTIKELAEYCKANGQYLLFETGQETPITLKRTIEYVGTGNLGINLDPASAAASTILFAANTLEYSSVP